MLAVDGCPLCSVALKLTMPGTPNVIYGDEIGLPGISYRDRGYMMWDDSHSGGFTSSTSFTKPVKESRVDSVLVGAVSLGHHIH